MWSVIVLCLLREGQMHPYELQRLIRYRHKHELLDLRRGSLYRTIERLERAELIVAVETSRDGKRPERTVYRLTDQGEVVLLDWLREMLAEPTNERPWFTGALSQIQHLPVKEAAIELGRRVVLLESEIGKVGVLLQELGAHMDRGNLLEVEYIRAMRQAELAWVRGLIQDIETGGIAWEAP